MTVSVALVVSPEHPHYRGGVTPGVLRRRAGPSGGLPPPGAAPLMRDLSRIHHRCYDQAYSAGDVPMMCQWNAREVRLRGHTRCPGNNIGRAAQTCGSGGVRRAEENRRCGGYHSPTAPGHLSMRAPAPQRIRGKPPAPCNFKGGTRRRFRRCVKASRRAGEW